MPSLPSPRDADTLTQDELLRLAVEATKLEDSPVALHFLELATQRPDATGAAFFMLGSEHAQAGRAAPAIACMARATELAPGFALARFQLGLLHLIGGDAALAASSWAPLAELGESHPQHYLAWFRQGLLDLIHDRFQASIDALTEGLRLNQDNPPLNADMHRILEAIQHLPTPTGQPGSQRDSTADAPAPVEHLFVNTYAAGSKSH